MKFSLPSLEHLDKDMQRQQLKKLSGKDFCSNDYLGLTKSAELKEETIRFMRENEAISSSASRLTPGYHHLHENVEEFLSQFFGSENGLIFNSGYAANTGLISTLCKNSIIFSDESNRASLVDGIHLSGSESQSFLHNNIQDLANCLENTSCEKNKFIIIESLSSNDGDLAPVKEIQSLAEKHNAYVIIDESHASGVYGRNGEGLVSRLPHRRNIISVHSFGKAFAGYGAFIACSNEIKDLLINFCREFANTTALPSHLVFHMSKSVTWVRQNLEVREKLISLGDSLRALLIERGFNVGTSESYIVPIILGSNEKVLAAEKALAKRGYQVGLLRTPAVQNGQERLRICVHADHRLSDLEHFCKVLGEASL